MSRKREGRREERGLSRKKRKGKRKEGGKRKEKRAKKRSKRKRKEQNEGGTAKRRGSWPDVLPFDILSPGKKSRELSFVP